MNAPVTTSPVRTTSPGTAAARSTGTGTGGNAFASMLDDVLSTDRPSGRGASDRGVERRSTPEDRASRAADRAAERAVERAERSDDAADRAADKAGKAAERTAHRAQQAAAHAAHAAHRAGKAAARAAEDADPGTEGDAPVGAPVDEAGVTAPAATDPADAPATTDASTAGASAAVWALLTGGSVASPGVTGASSTAGTETLLLAGSTTVTDAATSDLTAAAVGPALAPAAGTPTASVAAAVPDLVTAAPAAPTQALPTAEATTAGEAALAEFTVVRTDDVPTPTPLPQSPAPAPAAETVDPSAAGPTDVPAVETTVAATSPSELAAEPAVTAAAPLPQRLADPDASTTSDVTVPVAAVGTAGSAESAGTDTSSQQRSTDGGTPAPAPILPAGSPVATAPVVAPITTRDGATGASAAQPVSTQVARQVAVLADGPDGAHTMTLVLTPDSVGPVEVQVTLHKGAIDLQLRGAHEHGRAALLEALPDLRRDLETAGLTTSRLEVDRDSGGAWLDRHSAQQQAQQQGMATQHQGFGHRGARQDMGEGRSRSWARPADTGVSGPAASTNRSTSSGVDYRV
ncbi:MAG: flagellar hook-length control protein FliK [Blastococcus sp.]